MKTNMGILIALTFFMTTLAEAQTINSSKSKVKFKVANTIFNTATGSLSGMNGSINFNSNDLKNSSFDVCIKAKTINSGIAARDNHLKKKDFLWVDKHPNICFKSTSIVKTKSGYLAKGKLTLRGVTKNAEIPFTYRNKTFKGKLNINRYNYNVGPNNVTTVGNIIRMEVICVVK